MGKNNIFATNTLMNFSLFFDIQNIQERIIQNEFEWILIKNTWRKCRNCRFHFEREGRLQHIRNNKISIRWSDKLKDPLLLGRRFNIHDIIFLTVCRDLSMFFLLMGSIYDRSWSRMEKNKRWFKTVAYFQF